MKFSLSYEAYQKLVLFKNKRFFKIQNYLHREYFISPNYTLDRFFEALNNDNVDYVVIRWPVNGKKSDLDLLVRNSDLSQLSSKMIRKRNFRERNLIRVGVHLASGTNNSLPIFHSKFSELLLTKIQKGPFNSKIPEAKLLFAALVFHAVLHRGSRSGLKKEISTEPFSSMSTGSNYVPIIFYSALFLGINSEISWNGLLKYLEKQELLPPIDYLLKCEFTNPWLRPVIEEKIAHTKYIPGLTVFIIRKKYATSNFISKFSSYLESNNWNLLLAKELSAIEIRRCIANTRGSIWYLENNFSSDTPNYIVVAMDKINHKNLSLKRKHPWKDHGKSIKAKEFGRRILKSDFPQDAELHMLHSSDNAYIAMDYLINIGLHQKVLDIIERKEHN